jgi:hypothetical protein
MYYEVRGCRKHLMLSCLTPDQRADQGGAIGPLGNAAKSHLRGQAVQRRDDLKRARRGGDGGGRRRRGHVGVGGDGAVERRVRRVGHAVDVRGGAGGGLWAG